LISGYIEAVIEDILHALRYFNVKANNLMIVGDEFSDVQYGMLVCKKRPDLLKQITPVWQRSGQMGRSINWRRSGIYTANCEFCPQGFRSLRFGCIGSGSLPDQRPYPPPQGEGINIVQPPSEDVKRGRVRRRLEFG
jgi:hypothetical protein